MTPAQDNPPPVAIVTFKVIDVEAKTSQEVCKDYLTDNTWQCLPHHSKSSTKISQDQSPARVHLCHIKIDRKK